MKKLFENHKQNTSTIYTAIHYQHFEKKERKTIAMQTIEKKNLSHLLT